MEQEFRERLEAARHLVRRLHPHDRAAAPRRPSQSMAQAHLRRRRHLRGRLRRAGTASAARRSSRRRISSTAAARCIRRSSREWIREKNYFFRLSKYQRAAARSTSPRIPSFIEPDVRRNEILRLRRSRPRGHLGQPRRAVVGHPAAVRSEERRLRLVRRADQLRRRRSATARTTALFERLVAGRSARHRQGHHAVPLRDLAGDADERRAAAAAAGLRARLGARSTASG